MGWESGLNYFLNKSFCVKLGMKCHFTWILDEVVTTCLNRVIANIWCLLRKALLELSAVHRDGNTHVKKPFGRYPAQLKDWGFFVTYPEEKLKWSERQFLSWIPSGCFPAWLLRNIKLIPPLAFWSFFSVLHCCTFFLFHFFFPKIQFVQLLS